ncbi:unnamed protein product, partial [Prorocentrum cordatum]
AHRWGLQDTFDEHMTEMIKVLIGRGFVVFLADQWIKQQDRPHTNSWHPQKTEHNLVQLTQQFMHAATLRDLSASPLSLPTQPFPFRHPSIQPVNEYKGRAQARE